ncbi:MAG: hypothetical protein MMC33_007192 [Icmadophila ericetorum]|nr:hypothetical protein [Icmadophila ericetorum]
MYTYEKNLPRDSIRLLRITSDGERFSSTLEEFKLDRLPYFAAISWCWTSRRASRPRSFTCNAQEFPVSSHLYALLQNVTPRGVPASVTIWIDAICINQDHLEEKDVHIPRMSEIYSGAHFVLVWLGESQDDSDLVMDTQTVNHLNRNLVQVPDFASPDYVTRDDLPSPKDPIWRAIGDLCDRNWFYRTWVVQEVALARKVNMLCGPRRLDWASLVTLINHLSRTGLSVRCRDPQAQPSSRPNGIGVLLELHYVRKQHQEGGCPTDYILRAVRLKEVTKPIDKVYGIMGLLEKDMRNAITVNYAENEAQYWKIYMEVVKNIIATNNRSFWLLNMASSKERPEELPTWCPNLNSTIPEQLDFSYQPWCAGILPVAQLNAGMFVRPDSSEIRTLGFVIDEVQDAVQLGSTRPDPNEKGGPSEDSLISNFLAQDLRCLKLAQESYSREEEALEAYARTIVVNSWANFSPILASEGEKVCQIYRDTVAYLSHRSVNAADAVSEGQQEMHAYLRQLGWWAKRPFFKTKNGLIGRGPSNIHAGDLLCVFYGAGMAFVLRPRNGDLYGLVGDAYLHECMELETLRPERRGLDVEFVIC